MAYYENIKRSRSKMGLTLDTVTGCVAGRRKFSVEKMKSKNLFDLPPGHTACITGGLFFTCAFGSKGARLQEHFSISPESNR